MTGSSALIMFTKTNFCKGSSIKYIRSVGGSEGGRLVQLKSYWLLWGEVRGSVESTHRP